MTELDTSNLRALTEDERRQIRRTLAQHVRNPDALAELFDLLGLDGDDKP